VGRSRQPFAVGLCGAIVTANGERERQTENGGRERQTANGERLTILP